ncbi:hypothetical protein PTKIN_Ptkin14bG0170600 [Pterospermum kingtungense]
MNPYDEKRLRDEVIYLHYLWHQGPPQNTNSNPNKRPRPFTQYPTNKTKRFAPSGSCSAPKPDNGHDWSVFVNSPQPSSSGSGWPEPKSKPEEPTRHVSVEDQARFASLQMQRKVLECCREFFNKRIADDDDDDYDEEEEGESEVDKFFMGIFVNNSELRDYYEENHEKGEFFCLVCGGIGENVGKKFKGCVGLVQHCMSISKTKRMTGHRAFGLVVCKVLGWDIDRLPVILLKGEPLSHSLANARESQDKGDDLKVTLGNVESVDADGIESGEREVSAVDQSNVEVMVCENSLKGDDANKNVESLAISDAEPNNGAVNDQDKGDDLKVILGNVEYVDADGSESVEREVSAVDQSNGEVMVCENSLKGDDANKNVDSLAISDAEPNNGAVNDQVLESSEIRSTEWPSIEPAYESTSTTMEWPRFKPTASVTNVVPAEEQIRFNMVQLQKNVFETCKQFLSTTAESDSDEDDNEVDEDENDLMDEDGSEECREFDFFLRLFTENNELRGYYETNCRGGDFSCLVCCGIGKKAWRTFKDCVGLIKHSTEISKTKKKRAHRAFGQVICKVLGWDIARLPSIVLKSEPRSHSLENLSQLQHDRKAVCDKDVPDAPTDKTDSEPTSKEDIDSHQTNNMLIGSENSQNEEPSKDNDTENRTLDIGADEDKAVQSPVRSLTFLECLYINAVICAFQDC